jgi:hypothetical protein
VNSSSIAKSAIAEVRTSQFQLSYLWPMIVVLALACTAIAQDRPIFLWADDQLAVEGKPKEETVRIYENGEHIVSGVHRPSVTPYIPSESNRFRAPTDTSTRTRPHRDPFAMRPHDSLRGPSIVRDGHLRGASNGKDPIQALIYPGIPGELSFSTQTPPAFLICGEDDRPDIARGVPKLYLSLKEAGVSAELHVFAHTGHGFGMRPNNPLPVFGWIELFLQWLSAENFLSRR